MMFLEVCPLRWRVPPLLVRALLVQALVFALITCAGKAAETDGGGGETLVPGSAIERSLAAGTIERFFVEARAGVDWRVEVEQRGIDVISEVLDPDGRSLLVVDTPIGQEGVESLLVVPTVSGRFTLAIRSANPDAEPGRFTIRVDTLPAGTLPLAIRAEQHLTAAGRLFVAGGDESAAEALAEVGAAAEAWNTLSDDLREARARYLEGRLLERLDNRPGAVERYELALDRSTTAIARPFRAEVLVALGLARQRTGDFPRAADHLAEALELLQRLGRHDRLVETRQHLCLAYQRAGGFDAAVRCYERVLEAANASANRALAARMLNNLGGIDWNRGEPDAAFDRYQRALAIHRERGDRFGEAATLSNLGALRRGLGEVEGALLDYERAHRIFQQIGDRYWQARVLNNIGVAYTALGDDARARGYLLRALNLRRETGDRAGEAVTLRNLGSVSLRLGARGKAAAFYRVALERSEQRGDRRGEASSRKRLGEIHLRDGELRLARDQLTHALAIVQEMGKRHEEAEVLDLLARAHLTAEAIGEAERFGARALGLHQASQRPVGESEALITLARVAGLRGDHDAARQRLDSAIAILDNLEGRLGDPNRVASFQASKRQAYELTIDTLMALHERAPARGFDREALAVSEQARARALRVALSNMDRQAAAGEGEPRLRERLRHADRRFIGKTRSLFRLLDTGADAATVRVAERERFDALDDLENVRVEIRRYQGGDDHRGLESIDVRTIQGLLDDETVLLEYFLGERRSFVWRVTSETATVHALPPRQQIEALSQRVHQLSSTLDRSPAVMRKALTDLGQVLLGPFAGDLREQRLAIVTDGALDLVPFAALISPQTGTFLVVDHEIVGLPSATTLAYRARRPWISLGRPVTKTVAIFADPIYRRTDPRLAIGVAVPASAAAQSAERVPTKTQVSSPRIDGTAGVGSFERLAATGREAAAIAALVPAPARLVAVGADARRQRVIDGELRRHDVIHFATHGVIFPQVPRFSGLMLSRVSADGEEIDGFLDLYDIVHLELDAKLVVLSACRTALGESVAGEGLIGPTHAFLSAGVPRVVSSLWSVRDVATAALMTRFYQALLVDGLLPAAALRVAQQELRAARRFRDPFYWAAFTLEGDWR